MGEKNQRVMVDIETLGTDPGAVIVSLGAVRFGNGRDRETYFESIDPKSATNAGLEIDAKTLEWWLERNERQQAQLRGGYPLEHVLTDFNEFVAGAEELWANSPSFDLAIIKAAMDAVEITPSWEFYQERDFRTLKNLPGRPQIEQENKHHALADAEYQATVAEEMLERFVVEMKGVEA